MKEKTIFVCGTPSLMFAIMRDQENTLNELLLGNPKYRREIIFLWQAVSVSTMVLNR